MDGTAARSAQGPRELPPSLGLPSQDAKERPEGAPQTILPARAGLPRTTPPEDAKEASGNMLANIISLVSGCVTFLGGFLIVWGAVSLGLAIREQQGGAQIASAISTIAGGAIIVAAAVYFGMLDTSWLPA